MLLTFAVYRRQRREFENATPAFVWLIQRMRSARADLYEHYARLQPLREGRPAPTIAREVRDLYPRGLTRNWSHLGEGWKVNTCLSNADKLRELSWIAALTNCGLEFEDDWDFQPASPTNDLLAYKQQLRDSRHALDSLDKLLGE
jgi:hypothetical protein